MGGAAGAAATTFGAEADAPATLFAVVWGTRLESAVVASATFRASARCVARGAGDGVAVESTILMLGACLAVAPEAASEAGAGATAGLAEIARGMSNIFSGTS